MVNRKWMSFSSNLIIFQNYYTLILTFIYTTNSRYLHQVGNSYSYLRGPSWKNKSFYFIFIWFCDFILDFCFHTLLTFQLSSYNHSPLPPLNYPYKLFQPPMYLTLFLLGPTSFWNFCELLVYLLCVLFMLSFIFWCWLLILTLILVKSVILLYTKMVGNLISNFKLK